MLIAKPVFETVVHNLYPKHPRLLMHYNNQTLLVWPCGNKDHPLHASFTFIEKNYVRRDAYPHDEIDEELRIALMLATYKDGNDAACKSLLSYQTKIEALCQNAPKGTLVLKLS